MNLLQWQKLDCIHKGVCFHNGIKCGEFICRDIQPEAKERTCKVVLRDRDEYGEFAEYSCGHVNLWQSWNEPKYCCWCGARVVGD